MSDESNVTYEDEPAPVVPSLSTVDRYVILVAAFLGWMFAGLEMSLYLALRPAAIDLLDGSVTIGLEEVIGQWLSWYICAFLLGAALGGLVFGWLGDRIGRSKAMGLSILCYSAITGLSYFVTSLEQLVALRFVACLGVGGMWPNGVALASEAWPESARPLLAGLIGTAANVGLAVMGAIAGQYAVTPDSWRWVMLVGGAPFILGLIVLAIVPESPSWLRAQRAAPQVVDGRRGVPVTAVFRPPYLVPTLIGIALGTVPLLGGWGCLNWLITWADQAAGDALPTLKGDTQFYRSLGAALGSLLGGYLASLFGRRSTYFVICLCSVVLGQYIYRNLAPLDSNFLFWVFAMGFVATILFGWLPLYLPELFPTAVRATGSGVTFNFGRILSAVGVLGAGALMVLFEGDYARVGRVTSLIYALGMVVILFAPDTSGKRMSD